MREPNIWTRASSESSQEISLVVGGSVAAVTSVVPAPSAAGTLAVTGDSTFPKVQFGLALLVLGAGITIATTRKRLRFF